MLGAITEACSDAGVDVLLGTLSLDGDDRPLDVPRIVGHAGIDGDAGGAADATNALVARGHRKIVFAGISDDAPPAIAERRRGYDEAMRDAGLEPRHVDGPNGGPQALASAVVAELHRRRRFTAVVAANDAIGIAVLAELGARSISVPGDVSIIGFDDPEAARLVRPRLTTVTVSKPAMGRLATSMLFHRMDHRTSHRSQWCNEPASSSARAWGDEFRHPERDSGKAALPSRTPG